MKTVLFIDGANLYSAARGLHIDIDYKRLLDWAEAEYQVLRIYYYTAVSDREEFISIRPLLDWMEYNGYTVVTKPVKTFVDERGNKKIKGNMDIELAIDALQMAKHMEHMLLVSGDGDFKSLIEAVQNEGVKVTVLSTLETRPPMIADELRRQADKFVELLSIKAKIEKR